MWYIMETVQRSYEMSERLIRAISNWNLVDQPFDDDIEELINNGADVNQPHGSLLPLHCTCMVSDAECLQLLLQNGARVSRNVTESLRGFEALVGRLWVMFNSCRVCYSPVQCF